MIVRRVLTQVQAEHAMEQGEFDASVTEAAPNVAVVLTQDWCSQWKALEASLGELARGPSPSDPEITVFELLYNTVDYFSAFLSFKETKWRNYEIPYVRYYRGGRLTAESNYVPRERFLGFFRD
jgi:hypothetical protein